VVASPNSTMTRSSALPGRAGIAASTMIASSGSPASRRRTPTTFPATDAGATTKAIVSNATDAGALVAFSFGADSVVQPGDWSFCPDSGPCSLQLAAAASQELPTDGRYLNLSIAFNGPVGCGSTVAEFTANNPNGYGTADVSLVNGWNADVAILVDGLTLGPALDAGNADALGVFPYACDICVARSGPPCGIPVAGCTTPGSCGCKAGSQYNPVPPCQVTYQKAGAGSLVNVMLVP
jgi:hypothetical protein